MALLPRWEIVGLDKEDSRVYYWDLDSNKTQWSRPEGWVPGAPETGLPENGSSHLSFELFPGHPPRARSDIASCAVQSTEAPYGGLCVTGYRATLFRDAGLVERINRGRLLIPWAGDPSVTIDRYDARAGLTASQLACSTSSERVAAMDHSTSDVELDQERYRDLELKLAQQKMREEHKARGPPPPPLTGACKCLGRVKKDGKGAKHNANVLKFSSDSATEEAFKPSFRIPADVATPSTLVQHLVIEKTATYVRNNSSGQAELQLLVRQRSNPKFAFLDSKHPFHNYYVFLKKTGHRHEATPMRVRQHTAQAIEAAVEVVLESGKSALDSCGEVFSFMNPGDPRNAYFEWVLARARTAREKNSRDDKETTPRGAGSQAVSERPAKRARTHSDE